MIPKKKLHMIFDSSTAQSPGHNAKDDDDHPKQTPNLYDGTSTSYTGRLLTEDEIKKEPVEEEMKQEKLLVNVTCAKYVRNPGPFKGQQKNKKDITN